MYQVRFYLTERGDNPVQEFIESLDDHTQAKVAQLVLQIMWEEKFTS
jgi:hypothetical protein